jgi:hypothetical protein
VKKPTGDTLVYGLKGTLKKVLLPFCGKIQLRAGAEMERAANHNSSTPFMLRAHRLHRVGDSTSRAFRTAHRNRLRCRVIGLLDLAEGHSIKSRSHIRAPKRRSFTEGGVLF